MKKELDRALCDLCPTLYRERNGSEMKTCMCWGFPGDGWYGLLLGLSLMLEELSKDQPDGEKVKAVQVKEKFGGLRFYAENATKEMRHLISEAEAKSYKTCEGCGEAGSMRGGGWIKTLCDKCDSK